MKTLYIEPYCGVAGDMTVAALLGLGIDFSTFKKALTSLPITEKWDIELLQTERHAINANLFKVIVHEHHHHHNHDDNSTHNKHSHKHHHHRTLPEITDIINSATQLPDSVKKKACLVFAKLAEAEAEVHGKDISAVHFHEVGAVDAIIDITGACLAIEMLEIDKIISAPISLGCGSVHSAHGVLPVPVPATMNLIRGIPTEQTGIKSELATPTGAALLATLVDEWNESPKGALRKSSYGAGTRDLKERASVLRLSLYCDSTDKTSAKYAEDEVAVIECNIDDMSGELFSWLAERLPEIGALDFAFIPVIMKKNRPGNIIQVICRPNDVAKFADFLLKETTTIGVRYRIEKRFKLNREIRKISTKLGDIAVKVVKDNTGTEIKSKPEYEDIAKIAKEQNIPFREANQKIKKFF